jgi:hypothetical protein
MAITLAITGSVVKSDDAVSTPLLPASFRLFDLNITSSVNELAGGSVFIAPTSTHSIAMSHITTGKWFAFKVITASKDVLVALNGSATKFQARELAFCSSNLTSITLENPDTGAIEVQYLVGGI